MFVEWQLVFLFIFLIALFFFPDRSFEPPIEFDEPSVVVDNDTVCDALKGSMPSENFAIHVFRTLPCLRGSGISLVGHSSGHIAVGEQTVWMDIKSHSCNVNSMIESLPTTSKLKFRDGQVVAECDYADKIVAESFVVRILNCFNCIFIYFTNSTIF